MTKNVSRPSKEAVDFELDCARQPLSTATPFEWHCCARVLADEVEALREELAPWESVRALKEQLAAWTTMACEYRADYRQLQFGEEPSHIDRRDRGEALDKLADDIQLLASQNEQLRATLALVEALPKKWRENYGTDYEMHKGDCADELEVAIKGDSDG